jgi:hypothetical protein
MNIGPPPWIGECVRVIKGPDKGYLGYVRDVRPFPNRSGLLLEIELSKGGIQVNPRVHLDYDDVRHAKYVFFIKLCLL